MGLLVCVQIVGNIKFLNSNLNSTTAQTIRNSLAVNNLEAADGGGDGDTLEEIRQNALYKEIFYI